jgi:hypothetical protein
VDLLQRTISTPVIIIEIAMLGYFNRIVAERIGLLMFPTVKKGIINKILHLLIQRILRYKTKKLRLRFIKLRK